jgi:hypothetical protein
VRCARTQLQGTIVFSDTMKTILKTKASHLTSSRFIFITYFLNVSDNPPGLSIYEEQTTVFPLSGRLYEIKKDPFSSTEIPMSEEKVRGKETYEERKHSERSTPTRWCVQCTYIYQVLLRTRTYSLHCVWTTILCKNKFGTTGILIRKTLYTPFIYLGLQ